MNAPILYIDGARSCRFPEGGDRTVGSQALHQFQYGKRAKVTVMENLFLAWVPTIDYIYTSIKYRIVN